MYYPKKYKIKQWLGRYQSDMVYLHNGRYMRKVSYGLEKFFSYFPNTLYLNDIDVTDVTQYIEQRRSEGLKDSTIKQELKSVSQLYSWLINHAYYPGANPAAAYSEPDKSPLLKKRKSLTLDDVRRILANCDDPLTKDFILSLITGSVRMNGKTWLYYSHRLAKAFVACGLKPMRMSRFRELITRGVSSYFLRLHEQELRHAFATLDTSSPVDCQDVEEYLSHL